MAITVKKKKTLTLKSDAPAATDDQPVSEEPESVLATMRNPAAAPVKSGGSFVPYFIMALIACGLLGAVVAMQFIENSFYKGMVP